MKIVFYVLFHSHFCSLGIQAIIKVKFNKSKDTFNLSSFFLSSIQQAHIFRRVRLGQPVFSVTCAETTHKQRENDLIHIH